MLDSEYLELLVTDTFRCRTLHAIVYARTTVSCFLGIIRKRFSLKDCLFSLTDETGRAMELDSLHVTLDKIFIPTINGESKNAFTMHRVADGSAWNLPKVNKLLLLYNGPTGSGDSVSPVGDRSDDDSPIGLHSLYGDEPDQGNPTIGSDCNTCRAIVPVTAVHTSEVAKKAQSTIGESTPDDTVKFAGLVNSGMTCYMNSLLQTLFMTPEFRNALYLWRFNGTESEAVTSIPYQLQRLFVQLQTTKRTSVSTTGVTTSFGWRSHDVIQQQDIHELCRIMFDALEKKLSSSETPDLLSDHSYCQKPSQPSVTRCSGDDESKRRGGSQSSPTHDLINRLYQGQRSDCVRCTVCNRLSCRPDSFLDIQVPLRPFEENAEPYGSLEAAFRALIKPERLDGSNQYYCARCQTKRDAERVCGFHRMPYLLTLQLMRFTFDLTTLNRIKLNDRFTFPLDRWDLTEFITPTPVSTDDADKEDREAMTSDEDKSEHEHRIACGSTEPDDDLYATLSSTVGGVEFMPEMMVTEEVDRGDNARVAGHPNCETASDPSVIPLVYYGLAEGTAQEVHADEVSEDMETETVDSGVNSVADSPYGAASVGSGNSGSPSLDEDDTPSGHVTLEDASSDFVLSPESPTTSTLTTNGLAYAGAVAVATCPIAGPARTKRGGSDKMTDEDDEDEEADDGFGTGDTRSACSSSSHTNCALVPTAKPDAATSGATVDTVEAAPPHSELFQVTPTRKDDGGRRKAVPRRTLASAASGPAKHEAPASVYELFSIMVHSGSINGGHYYAYIRSFNDNQWYCFNDQKVSKASQSDLEQTFGSGQTTYSSQANAYFLMYRRVDADVNEQFMTPEQFPPHIRDMVDAVKAEEAEADRQRDLELSTYKFEVYARLPPNNKVIEKIVHLYKSQTVRMACKAIREALLPKLPCLEPPNCRLVEYAQHKGAFGRSWDYFSPTQAPSVDLDESQADRSASTELTIGEVAGTKLFFPFELWLEHRVDVPGSIGATNVPTWRSYQQGGLTLRVHRVDIGQGIVYESERLWLSPTDTAQDLAKEVWQLYMGQPTVVAPDSAESPFDASQLQAVACLPRSNPSNRSPDDCLFPWANLLIGPSLSGEIGGGPVIDQLYDSGQQFVKPRFESILVYVDLGPATDGLIGASDQQGKPAVVEPKRGRWQLDRDEATPPPSGEVARLHRLCSLLEEHLFAITVTLEVPSEPQISSFLLLRSLLAEEPAADQPMDVSPIGVGSSDSSSGSLAVLHTSSAGSLTTFSQPSHSSPSAPGDSSGQMSPLLSTNRHNTSPVSWQDAAQECSYKPYTPHDLADALCAMPTTEPSHGSPPIACGDGDAEKPRADVASHGQSTVSDSVNTCGAEMDSSSQPSSRYLTDTNGSGELSSPSINTSQMVAPPVDTFFVTSSSGQSSCSRANCHFCRLFAGRPEFSSAVQLPLRCHFLDDPLTPLHPRVLEVRLDRRMNVSQLLAKMSEHIPGVEPQFLKVVAQWSELDGTSNFLALRSGARIQMGLSTEVTAPNVRLQLHVLDLAGIIWSKYPCLLTGSSIVNLSDQRRFCMENYPPVWTEPFSLVIRSTWTVSQILSTASAVVSSLFQIPAEEIPPNQLILRRCSLPERTPGPPFELTDRLCSYGTLHQGIMLQLPSSYDLDVSLTAASSSPGNGAIRTFSVFARRWQSSQVTSDRRWRELVLPSQCAISRESRWSQLGHCLSRLTRLPPERLLVAKCDFPGNSFGDLGLTWTPCATPFDWKMQSAVPGNGQVVYFRDATEPVWETTVDERSSKKQLPVYGPKPLSDYLAARSVPIGLRSVASSSSLDHLDQCGPSSPAFAVGVEQSLRIYTAEDNACSTGSSRSTNASSFASTHRTSRRESRTP